MSLILCRQEPVTVPLYIEDLGIHIYSSQELCYVIYNNPLLVLEEPASLREAERATTYRRGEEISALLQDGVLAAGLDGIENRMVLQAPVNRNLFHPAEAEGLGLETLPASLEEAVQAAQESEFLHRVLPDELAARYFTEELKRCEALKNAADPAEYERVHYFNAI